ncbi:MAG: DUF4102 domain-containing protein [Actinobacteria bacterium]|uniref:Unannotated protein n=1 Tax=freshwater metagenome TaxID=449393 RepID=A0A6J5YVX7_9ZZZZ|nr:DUF4102 domain-containing protein [Actinomycetota bacterium]
MKLTQKGIDAMPRPSSRREIADDGVVGLYLVVQPSGSKSWAYRYRFGGVPRKLTLGAYPALSIKDGRDAARSAMATLDRGRDPADDKRREKQARLDGTSSVDHALNEFITLHVKARNRPTTIATTVGFIDGLVRPAWARRSLKSISKADVNSLLRSIVERGTPATANRTHAILRKFFGWCAEQAILEVSPAAGVKAPAKSNTSDRVLTNDEIALCWAACDRIGWPFGPMVQLLLLTGQRRSEVAGMRWAELDLRSTSPTWTIPKERSKNAKAHTVPLSDLAVQVINALPRVASDAGYCFTTNGEASVSGYSKGKARLDAAMVAVMVEAGLGDGDRPPTVDAWRLHDLRRTAATGMAGLGTAVHVVEAALNHVSGRISGVAAIYNRFEYADEKRVALQTWANHLRNLTA